MLKSGVDQMLTDRLQTETPHFVEELTSRSALSTSLENRQEIHSINSDAVRIMFSTSMLHYIDEISLT